MKHEESKWDKIFSNIDVNTIPFPSPLAEQFGQIMSLFLPHGSSVLEAGSGTGELSAYLAQRGYRVTLLDTSQVALDVSKRLFAKYNLLGEFQKGDLFHMPFADESFDCVWNSGVMEHFSDKEIVEGLQEMKRVSRNKIVVLVPNAFSIFYRLGKWSLERRGVWPYGKEIPKRSLRSHFGKAGLRVIQEDFLQVYSGIVWMAHIGEPRKMVNRYLFWAQGKILAQYHKNPQRWERNVVAKKMLGYLLISIGSR